jgi:ectoine hydroxylase-related dioxygenase (phytanoyl-CoA dioxygenase family)
MSVTESDIARFQEDGAVCLRNVVSAEWLEFLRGASRELRASPGPMAEEMLRAGPAAGEEEQEQEQEQEEEEEGSASPYFTDLEMAQRLPPFARFARHGPCAALAGQLMQASQACFLYDQYFEQRFEQRSGPRSEQRSGPRLAAGAPATPWHQDQPYWQVAGADVASVWVPLDPTPAGAAVHFIAGSHRWREHAPFHFGSGAQYAGTHLPPLPDVGGGVREGRLRVLSWPDCAPGDAIVFSAMVVHGQDARLAAAQRAVAGSGAAAAAATAAAAEGAEGAPPLGAAAAFRRLATRFTGDDARYRLRDGEARNVVPSEHFPCGLAEGARMECARFPLVWTAPRRQQQQRSVL